MLTTYDPVEDAVILDSGLMISRSQCHFFGYLVPETIFDLASRLHLVDPDLRVVMQAALSALATIDPGNENVYQTVYKQPSLNS